MTLTLFNTAARALQPFEPLEPGKARIYACGPTIYDHAHIGNFRTFLFFDLVHRYLEWTGYEVRFVMNLTDVDDKTIRGARDAGVSVRAFTEPFGEAVLHDLQVLGVRPADAHPRATEYVEPMIGFVERLIESGHAYRAEDGAVYFSIAKFPEYGKLKGIDVSTLKSGARVAQDEYDKDDARDFVLWKAATPDDEAANAAWDSPWGRGRPGWHLECSVMSVTELGDTLDLHLGGEDLVFPHHENEIAQSEAATGHPFVRYWLHVKHLFVEGRKMSKSLGNFITVRELLDEGHDPVAIRHLLLSSHYRGELNFTAPASQRRARPCSGLLDFEARLDALPVDDGADATRLPELAEAGLERFRAAMDADLNTADALAAVFTMVSGVNGELQGRGAVRAGDRDAVLAALRSMDEVLGLLEVAHATRTVDDDLSAWVEERIEARAAARARKDFAEADAIRDEITGRGIVLEDGAGGTRWKFVG
jgi:cysteinyl-tRNA synthetase